MTIKEMFLIAILRTYQIHVAQGDIKEQITYTDEANATFKEQIGDEMDVRDVPMNAPIKNDEDIKREQEEKGYVLRKRRKGAAAEVSQNLNQQTKMGLKDVLCKDKTQDLFKDLIYAPTNDLVKEDHKKWVALKFQVYKTEKNMRKIQNLVKSR